jgi:hypothetical protein
VKYAEEIQYIRKWNGEERPDYGATVSYSTVRILFVCLLRVRTRHTFSHEIVSSLTPFNTPLHPCTSPSPSYFSSRRLSAPARMIGNSWPEYVFIRFSIIALRLIAPLSIIYLVASYHAAAFLWSPFLGAYALLEAAFYLFVYLPRSFYLQQVSFPSKLPFTLTYSSLHYTRMLSTRRACLSPNARCSSINVPSR